MRSCCRVAHEWRSRTFFCNSAKKLSIAAVVPGCADPAHRTGQLMAVQGVHEFLAAICDPRSETTMQPATVGPLGGPSGKGVVDRGDGEPGLHPGVDGVTDDAIGVHVLDRAQVELALSRAVLGDVGQPQLV